LSLRKIYRRLKGPSDNIEGETELLKAYKSSNSFIPNLKCLKVVHMNKYRPKKRLMKEEKTEENLRY